MQQTVILSSLCKWKRQNGSFVVKRYAVREAEKWRYAVRKAKIGRYAVYQGGGVTLMYVVFIVWMGVKHTHSNFGVARFPPHLMQFITYSQSI